MNSISNQLKDVLQTLPGDNKVTLVAVSKTHPVEKIQQAYQAGQRHFGENKVQELLSKVDELPTDIHWHLIGHLQSNKVKYIAPFVYLIHSVDSLKLLKEIEKQGRKAGRTLQCLLQIFIASEETKYGLSEEECTELLESDTFKGMEHVKVRGLMGMASNTDDTAQVRREFASLKQFFDNVKQKYFSDDPEFDTLSMGMSGDYELAVEEGSNMVRVGSLIFGQRDYSQA